MPAALVGLGKCHCNLTESPQCRRLPPKTVLAIGSSFRKGCYIPRGLSGWRRGQPDPYPTFLRAGAFTLERCRSGICRAAGP